MQDTGHEQPQSSGGSLPPIATKPGTHWREFRIRFIPIIVFAATLIGIWFLWRELPGGAGIRGIGEGEISMLSSPHDGFLQQQVVPHHGWAEAGEPVVTIRPFDPGAQMDIFQSQLQVARLALEPSVADRNVLNYEQIRIDALRLEQELAMAQANLDRAEKVLPRHEALLKENLISRDIYDLTLRDRDFYAAEVREKSKALQEIRERLDQLQYLTQTSGTNGTGSTLLPHLRGQMASIATNLTPVTLEAPISGEVNYARQAHEFVRAGEILLVINSPRADRVIAYLKQPLPFEPEVGMRMEVTTRSRNPRRFITSIAQVGARMEVLTNSVAYLQAGMLVDTALPLILPVPPDVTIRPGEVVDIALADVQESGSAKDRLFGVLK